MSDSSLIIFFIVLREKFVPHDTCRDRPKLLPVRLLLRDPHANRRVVAEAGCDQPRGVGMRDVLEPELRHEPARQSKEDAINARQTLIRLVAVRGEVRANLQQRSGEVETHSSPTSASPQAGVTSLPRDKK